MLNVSSKNNNFSEKTPNLKYSELLKCEMNELFGFEEIGKSLSLFGILTFQNILISNFHPLGSHTQPTLILFFSRFSFIGLC